MTLSAKHHAVAYPAVSFVRRAPAIGEVARTLQQLEQPIVVFDAAGVEADETDSGLGRFDEHAKRIEPLRQKLALRRIKGETLADDEALVLAILNHRLAELVPAPAAMPARVEQAMLEAERLLAKHARG